MGDVRWLMVCTFTMLVTMTVRSDELEEDAEGHVYSNSWAVKVAGGVDVADRIAEKHGFKNLGQVSGASVNWLWIAVPCRHCLHRQVGSLSGYYHFVHESSPKRSARSLDDKHRHLSIEEEVGNIFNAETKEHELCQVQSITHLVGGVCRAAEGYKESKTGLYSTCGPLLASGVVLGTLFTLITCTILFLCCLWWTLEIC